MHDRANAVRRERLGQFRGVLDVALDDRRRVPGGRAVTLAEVVVNDDRLAARGKRLDGMTADISGSARDQNGAHGRPIEM